MFFEEFSYTNKMLKMLSDYSYLLYHIKLFFKSNNAYFFKNQTMVIKFIYFSYNSSGFNFFNIAYGF